MQSIKEDLFKMYPNIQIINSLTDILKKSFVLKLEHDISKIISIICL